MCAGPRYGINGPSDRFEALYPGDRGVAMVRDSRYEGWRTAVVNFVIPWVNVPNRVCLML